MLGLTIFTGVLALISTATIIFLLVLARRAHKVGNLEEEYDSNTMALYFFLFAVLVYLFLAVFIMDMVDTAHADMVKAEITEEICKDLNISKDSVDFSFKYDSYRSEGYSDVYNVIVSTEPSTVYQALWSKTDIKLIKIGN